MSVWEIQRFRHPRPDFALVTRDTLSRDTLDYVAVLVESPERRVRVHRAIGVFTSPTLAVSLTCLYRIAPLHLQPPLSTRMLVTGLNERHGRVGAEGERASPTLMLVVVLPALRGISDDDKQPLTISDATAATGIGAKITESGV